MARAGHGGHAGGAAAPRPAHAAGHLRQLQAAAFGVRAAHRDILACLLLDHITRQQVSSWNCFNEVNDQTSSCCLFDGSALSQSLNWVGAPETDRGLCCSITVAPARKSPFLLGATGLAHFYDPGIVALCAAGQLEALAAQTASSDPLERMMTGQTAAHRRQTDPIHQVCE